MVLDEDGVPEQLAQTLDLEVATGSKVGNVAVHGDSVNGLPAHASLPQSCRRVMVVQERSADRPAKVP